MSHKVKSNGSVKELAELQELKDVKVIAESILPKGLIKEIDISMNEDAAQDGAFVDIMMWTAGRNPLPGKDVYVLSFMGPKAANHIIFGYRNYNSVYSQIWAI